MDETTWLACADPQPMLAFLRGKASARKLRLFACACCRRIWHFLSDPRALDALQIAELFAEDLVGDADRSAARKAAQQAAQPRGVMRIPDAPKWARRAASTVYYATARHAMEAAYNAPQLAIESLLWRAGGYAVCDVQAIERTEQAHQAGALRDLLGNPFRPVVLEAASQTSLIVGLAQAAHQERSLPDGCLDNARLAILADALEEAGCPNADLLGHLR